MSKRRIELPAPGESSGCGDIVALALLVLAWMGAVVLVLTS